VRTLHLTACGCTFLVECDGEAATLLLPVFSGLLSGSSRGDAPQPGRYRIESCGAGFRVRCTAGPAYLDDRCSLLAHLDTHLTLALQRSRPDLYFLHAAAVARNGRVAVIPGVSGSGKSTLTLALLDHGFTLLSDELSPVDLRSGTVHPYARALCLKSTPPPPYHLPYGAIQAGGHWYVTLDGVPALEPHQTLPVAAFVFLRRSGTSPATCSSISPARGAAQLLANALNPLAHEGHGLHAAVTLARRVRCYELDSADLGAACAALEHLVQTPAAPRRGNANPAAVSDGWRRG
jgi:hypothetical protein